MIVRTKYLNMIADGLRDVPVVVLVGTRGVGKTTLMGMFETKGKRLTLNGQETETAAMFKNISIIEQYLKSYLNKNLKGCLLLDEFQYIINLYEIVDVLIEKYKDLKIICSGSSSVEAMSLRKLLPCKTKIIEVLPLSFEEFLMVKDKKLYKILQDKNRGLDLMQLFSNMFNEYMTYGGMPRIAFLNGETEKQAELENLLKFMKKSSEHHSFIALLKYLAMQTGNMVNINAISAEIGVSYRKCEEYMNRLEQGYIIKMTEPYVSDKRKSITKMKKVFFCDTGLRNMIVKNFNSMDFRLDNEAIFKNYIMLELWRNKQADGTIRFFKTSDGTEVDFVLDNITEKIAVNCKYKTMSKPTNLVAFTRFCDDENIQKRYIVNKNLNMIHNDVKFVQGYNLNHNL